MAKRYKRFSRYDRKKRKSLVATKKYVKKVLDNQIENKYQSTAVGPFGSLINMQYNQFNSMSQGVDVGQRVGNRIRLKSLTIKYIMYIDPAVLPGITAPRNVRLVLIYDKQANGAVPTTAELLSSTVTDQFMTTLDPAGGKRFVILFDKIFNIKPLGMSANNATSEVIFSRKINLRNKLTVYNSSAASIIGINTGSLTMGHVSDGDVLIRYQAQLEYEDA